MCMHACHVRVWPQKPEEGVGFYGAGIRRDYEQPDLGIANQTWVLWKKSKCSQTLRYNCS